MKHTPLYDEHRAMGARMIPFGEWEMPERYTGIIEEHNATRTTAGLFDLSHMGEIYVSGAAASELVQYLLTNDISALPVDAALYSPMCNDDGGIVDDLIVYHLGYAATHYLLVVNAANIAKDFDWIRRTAYRLGIATDVDVEDRSDATALLALQGPRAEEILQPLMVDALRDLASFHVLTGDITNRIEAMVARTGYTGEDGFEIFVNRAEAVDLWRLLLERGSERMPRAARLPDPGGVTPGSGSAPQGHNGLVPVGLGARDTLRLEARLPLYGNDIDETTTPLEAGLQRFVKLDGPGFCGRAALVRQRDEGVRRRLVGLEMLDRAIPRPHYAVLAQGREVGHVTSGTFSPTLGKGIALAYVPTELSTIGTELAVQVRGQPHPARVVKTPFYRRSAISRQPAASS
jgi:aminomethyltransferase